MDDFKKRFIIPPDLVASMVTTDCSYMSSTPVSPSGPTGPSCPCDGQLCGIIAFGISTCPQGYTIPGMKPDRRSRTNKDTGNENESND